MFNRSFTDHEQKAKVVFSPNEEPTTTVVNEAKPFVLNPGRWNLHISSPKRLFLVRSLAILCLSNVRFITFHTAFRTTSCSSPRSTSKVRPFVST